MFAEAWRWREAVVLWRDSGVGCAGSIADGHGLVWAASANKVWLLVCIPDLRRVESWDTQDYSYIVTCQLVSQDICKHAVWL